MQGRVSWFLLVGAESAAGYSKEMSITPRLDFHLVPGGAPFWLLSGPDPSKRSPAALLGFPLFSFPKSVPAACVQTCFVSLLVEPFVLSAARILQKEVPQAVLGCGCRVSR